MTFPRAMASRYASGSRISRGARRFLLLWLFLLSTRRPLHAEACVPNRLHGHSAHASNLAIRQIEPVEDLHLAHEASLGLKVEILDRFDLADGEIARVCGVAVQSVRNARLSVKRSSGGKKKKPKK